MFQRECCNPSPAGLCAFIYIMIDELLPIFAAAPPMVLIPTPRRCIHVASSRNTSQSIHLLAACGAPLLTRCIVTRAAPDASAGRRPRLLTAGSLGSECVRRYCRLHFQYMGAEVPLTNAYRSCDWPKSLDANHVLLPHPQGFPGLNAYLGLRNMTIYGFVFTSVTAMLLPLPSLCVGSRTMEMVVRAFSTEPALVCFMFKQLMSRAHTKCPSARLNQGLYGALGLRGAAAVTVFTNAMMLVNAAAPAGQLGEVNGVGQAVGAFVRGFGPELIGLIWSWFVESGWHGEAAGMLTRSWKNSASWHCVASTPVHNLPFAAGSQFGAWAFISVVSFGGVYTYQTVPFEELAARKQKGAAAASRSAAGAAGTSSSGDQQGGDGGDQPAPGTSSPTTDREQQQIEGLSSAWGLGGGAKSRRASADGRPPAGGGAVAASPPTTAAEPHGG